MKNSLLVTFPFFALCAIADAGEPSASTQAPSPIRRWDFEEGRWDLAKNSAPVFPGRIGPRGGPLGSLTIPRTTAYGMDFDAYEPREPDAAQPSWTAGRAPGFGALRLGTRKDGPFGSGLSGAEFASGFTFSGWLRLHTGPDGTGSATIMCLGDAWNTGFRISAEAQKWCPDGQFSARFALPAGPDGEKRRADLIARGFAPGVWHFFALVWDGATLRAAIDGREAASVAMADAFVPLVFPGNWIGVKPFFENVVPSRFCVGGPSTTALDIDEISLFDRALSPEELAAVRGVPAAGKPEEQAADAAAQDAARARAERVTLEIPRDTGGHFRIGEEIAATALVPADAGFAPKARFTATFALSTLDGEPLETRRRDFAVGEAVREAFVPPRCGAYYLDMEIRDGAGAPVKRYDEPWCIGFVPPKPDSLDSPYGYWATQDSFSHDSNLRRLGCYFGKNEMPEGDGWKQAAQTEMRVRLFLEKQRIPADELRLFSWLSIENTKEKSLPEDRLARLRDVVWPRQIALLRRLGCREFEFTSEQDGSISPEAYFQQLSILVPMVRAAIPDAILYPAGATPVGVAWTERVFSLGAASLVDGASIHAYTGNPLRDWHGGYSGTKFRDAIRAMAPDMPLYCTEIGIAGLPRVQGRPMTRLDADRAPYRVAPGEPSYYQTSMPTFPENECAAVSCQQALLTLALGFRTYVQCQHSVQGALPGLPTVARTALSGQILNHMAGTPKMLPLATLRSAAVLVERKDGSNALAVFGTADEPVSFLAPAGAKFRTMDLYGNYGEIAVPADGLLTLTAHLAPLYLFDVPESFAPVAPLRFDVPDAVPATGELAGTLCVTNPFAAPLRGALAVDPVRGADIALGAETVDLAPRAATNVALRLDGRALKRGNFTLRAALARDGGAPLAAERIVHSDGVEYMLPRLPDGFPLDGDPAKWDALDPAAPTFVADDEQDVSLGKPDPACPWNPQWTGPKDLTLRVRAGWTSDSSVRFLLEVTDDVFLPAPPDKTSEAFKWDSLELFVDSRANHLFGSQKKTRGADQIVIVPAAGTGDAAAPCGIIHYPGGDEPGVDVQCVGRRTATGWLVEGRIAAGYRQRFALDFLVDDRDSLEIPRKAAMAIHGHVGNSNDIPVWGRYKLDREARPKACKGTDKKGN